MTNEPHKSPSAQSVRPATLVELLRLRSFEQGEREAYTFLRDGETDEVRQTYAGLDEQARAIAATLQAMDGAGARALLLYAPGLDYIAAFFGCLYAGVIAVPVYPPRLNQSLRRLQAIVSDSEATIALTTSGIRDRVLPLCAEDEGLKSLCWIATDRVEAARSGEWREPVVGSDDLAFLQYTSGSTGKPKGVMLSHGNLLHNSMLLKSAFEYDAESRCVSWLPMYHDMGLIGGVLQPLHGGYPCTLMSPVSFLQSPVRWLRAITRYRATISGGPNFAYDLCARKISEAQRESLDLGSWSSAFNGAEPVRAETLARFADRFAAQGFRRDAFYPCYGLAEATLIVSGGAKALAPVVRHVQATALESHRVVAAAEGDEEARPLVSSGRALLDQRIAIVHPERLTESQPGQVGEIWVASPSVAKGYWNQAAETRRTFQAHIAETGEGPFLRTGDLGFMLDGELFVTGRLKDLLIIRGRNHYPQDIEATVEKCHSSLRAGSGAAFSVEVGGEERLVIAQEVKRTPQLDLRSLIETIQQAVTEQHELQAHAVVLVRPGTIPKTSSGKIQRSACREAYLTDQLEIVEAWQGASGVGDSKAQQPAALSLIPQQAEAVEGLLVSYLAERLGLEPGRIDVNQPISRYGVDSLLAVELTHFIESGLGVNLSLSSVLQSPTLAELAAQALAQLKQAPTVAPAVLRPSAETLAESPLSYGQQSLWFMQQLAPESAAYNLAGAARIRQEIDADALERAFQSLVNAHPALRTTFTERGGNLLQRTQEQVRFSLDAHGAAGWSEAQLGRRLAEEAQRPFNLEAGPLLRVSLYSRSAREHVLLLVIHHIITDFWSLAVMLRDLRRAYQSELAGEGAALVSPALGYADYVRWQAEMLSSPEGLEHWKFWQQQLAGELPVVELPADHPRPPVQTYHGDAHTLRLDRELTRAVEMLGRANGATLFMTLLSAFQTLLHRYTGQEDIVLGTMTAGRNRAALADVLGYFVNPVAIRSALSAEQSFESLLRRTRQTVLDAFKHQDYPFGLLVERLQPERDASRSPIFNVAFLLQKSALAGEESFASFALGEAGASIDLGGLAAESVRLEQRDTQFDLTLAVAKTGGELIISFQYRTELFEAETIKRMGAHFERLLRAAVNAPEQKLAELQMLTESEQRQLSSWNHTTADYPRGTAIHRLFESQVERTPEGVALICEDEQLTYRELNRRANQLAHHLRAHGVGSGALVGLMVERSSKLVIAVLAVLKAGAAYVPLDPQYPRERLAFMLRDAGVRLLLTEAQFLEGAPEHGLKAVCMDASREAITGEREAITGEREENPEALVAPSELAYVIYTSGSTGQPKGVQVSHQSVVNFLHSMLREPGITRDDLLLAVTSLSFDIAGLELYLPLIAGARVALVNHETASDGERLKAKLESSGATMLQATPATWRMLVDAGWQGSTELKALCGGEALPPDLARQLLGKCASLWNMYGPTETTIWSTLHRVGAGEEAVAIGHAIANTRVYVLDAQLRKVPVGVPGELYIGGEGLARGYLRRPELTAEKFLPEAHGPEPGGRMYRTGDVVRRLADGRLEYVGRADHQVKVRGFRIELGEVEAVLSLHPSVRQAVVLVRKDQAGNGVLAAYLVADAQETLPTPGELRRFLREQLPEHMIPTSIAMLEALPLTPNGKIDRRALLELGELSTTTREAAFVAPDSPAEIIMAGIWSRLLGVEQVGIEDSFFDLGGHSLLASQLMFRVRDTFRVSVSLRDFFEAPTITGLLAAVARVWGGREIVEEIASTLIEIEQLSGDQVKLLLEEVS